VFKVRLDLKRLSPSRIAGTKMELDEWIFENLTKEQLKSSGVIQ
jgi:hypothetical protein